LDDDADAAEPIRPRAAKAVTARTAGGVPDIIRDMSDVWWANAFVGPGAAGNATCVVVDQGGGDDGDGGAPTVVSERRAAIARSLRAPDTVFVGPPSPSGVRAVHFCSPFEGAMSFCGQALVATDAVLRAGYPPPEAADAFELEGPLGPVRTHRRRPAADATAATASADAIAPVSWFDVARASVLATASSRLSRDLAPAISAHAPATVVDSGRRRVFQPVSDPAALAALVLDPALVLAHCRAAGVSGVCFFVITPPDRVDLRVFTVSLAGAEDAATGGAVLGLAPLIGPGRWQVHQGGAHPLGRGLLFLDDDPGADVLSVGGRVELVARGQLIGDRA